MINPFATIKNWKNKEHIILGCVLALAFIIFLFTIHNYGASYDEPFLYDYADVNLTAYSKFALNQPYQDLFSFRDLRYYGPAYLILGGVAKNLVLLILPAWDRYDAWHLINFSAFLFSAWMLFLLCQRLVSKKAALFAALLYTTQPVLWGHGIMNPKDSPFMVSFIISMAAGLKMVEVISAPTPPASPVSSPQSSNWRRIFWGQKTKYLSVAGLILLAALTVDRFFHNFISLPIISSLINSASNAPPGTTLAHIFSLIAPNAGAIPAAAYIEKASNLVNLIELVILLLACLGPVIYLLKKASPKIRWTILAGLMIGITTAIRILGPAAAFLVILYLLLKKCRQPVKYILLYFGVSVLTAFVLWPYIWSDTFNRLAESIQVMVNFPWPGVVLFEGSFSRPKALPWYYLIKLLAIQFTLPLVILSVVGIGLAVIYLFRRGSNREETAIPLLWFLVPVAGEIVLNLSLYNNFRQLLFVTPSLFIFAAVAYDRLRKVIRTEKLMIAISVILLAPGIIAQVWLYPMQYIYYNALVGWTGNVQGVYETDYWETSLCQAAQFLNKNAPLGSSVALHDTIQANLFRHCSRYNNFNVWEGNPDQFTAVPDYAVAIAKDSTSQVYFSDLQVIKTIGFGNLTFIQIRKAEK